MSKPVARKNSLTGQEEETLIVSPHFDVYTEALGLYLYLFSFFFPKYTGAYKCMCFTVDTNYG